MKILSYNLPRFEANVAKLNKKAAKLGLAAISYEVVGTSVEARYRTVSCEGEHTEQRLDLEVTELRVTGEAPKLNGWAVTAKIESTEVAGENFVWRTPLSNPDVSLDHLRCVDMYCDHCNTRRAKKKVYQITHEDGTTKVVGASCLQDFTRCTNVEAILSFLNGLADIDVSLNDFEEGGYAHRVYDIKDILARSFRLIKEFGFVSKGKAMETGEAATAEWVHPDGEIWKGKFQWTNVKATDAEIEKFAEDCYAWIAASTDNSDYMYNLRMICKKEWTLAKHFGMVCAGANSYIKELEKRAVVAKKSRSNEFFGEVGQRVNLPELIITKVFPLEGQYGMTYLTHFEDEAGNCFVWFTSKRPGDVGDKLKLKATIKDHKVYEGRNQTHITRAAEI